MSAEKILFVAAPPVGYNENEAVVLFEDTLHIILSINGLLDEVLFLNETNFPKYVEHPTNYIFLPFYW